MITITNGSHSMIVTKGTYNQVYKSLGWQIRELNKTKPIAQKEPEPIQEIKELVQEETKIDAVESDDEVETDSDEIQNEDLEEKPISEMTPEELKVYATQLGIDFTGVKKAKVLRQMIREKLL